MCYLILSWSNKIVCNPAQLCVSAPSQNVTKSAANTLAPVLARSLNQKPLVTRSEPGTTALDTRHQAQPGRKMPEWPCASLRTQKARTAWA